MDKPPAGFLFPGCLYEDLLQKSYLASAGTLSTLTCCQSWESSSLLGKGTQVRRKKDGTVNRILSRQGWRLQDADMESSQAKAEVGTFWGNKLRTPQERPLRYCQVLSPAPVPSYCSFQQLLTEGNSKKVRAGRAGGHGGLPS